MIIHVYTLCWNEEKMLPFFFKHYDDIADQYFVFDNGSTDQSLSILDSHPKVAVEHFETQGGSFIKTALNLFNHFWKRSRGKADWVIVCETDEHLHHPNLRKYLEDCSAAGTTLVIPTGYNMVSDFFPSSDRPLSEQVKNGRRDFYFDKPQIFNPNEIQEINFYPGRHNANPSGNVARLNSSEILLLHYKCLGYEYLHSRHAALKEKLQKVDEANGWGSHYSQDEQKNWRDYSHALANAGKVLD
ncbi:glycosyltransferase family 2 protein [Bacillus infantis]|uniref:glycosyltransferase family 2 protein n=1 Tax=Bacillus infantis TaxID=324767 RepID=UPI003CFA9DC3